MLFTLRCRNFSRKVKRETVERGGTLQRERDEAGRTSTDASKLKPKLLNDRRLISSDNIVNSSADAQCKAKNWKQKNADYESVNPSAKCPRRTYAKRRHNQPNTFVPADLTSHLSQLSWMASQVPFEGTCLKILVPTQGALKLEIQLRHGCSSFVSVVCYCGKK